MTLTAIKDAIEQLPEPEQHELLDWLDGVEQLGRGAGASGWVRRRRAQTAADVCTLTRTLLSRTSSLSYIPGYF